MHGDLWDPQFSSRNGVFQDLADQFDFSGFSVFPSLDELNHLLGDRIAEALQQPAFRFVPDRRAQAELRYEEQIFQRAEVPTRICWHDFFGALSWGLFPRAKAAINRQHVEDMAREPERRTPRRDRLTHFDECGLVLAHASPDLVRMLRSHSWREVLYDRRQDWMRTVRPFVFGHAIYEKALSPYIGLTAKYISIQVEPAFFGGSLSEQNRYLDMALARFILDQNPFAVPGALSPLPLLGVPGYCDANLDPMFYENKEYFRPRR